IVSARWSSTTATTCWVAPSEVKLSELGATWRLVATGTNGSVPLQAARAMVTNVIGAERRRVTGIGVTIPAPVHGATLGKCSRTRSEEHTSELQSRFDLVCRLLLEKK